MGQEFAHLIGKTATFLAYNRIYGNPLSAGYKGTGIGKFSLARGQGSIAIGNLVHANTNAIDAIVIGKGPIPITGQSLTNNIPNSLMIGFGSTQPTMVVLPSTTPTGTGNVGIGTTTPSAKLHVVNPTSTGLTVTTQHAGDYGYGIISEVNQNFTKAIAVLNNATGGSQSFVVYGDGRVGIGGADPDGDPTYKLVVCGTIRSKEWVVENFAGCDFVFEPNYQRMTWQEKEKYFKTNKHLKGIVPVKESDKNGLKAGETISGIIMNVEENSLDIIDLQKENETLKKEVVELKKQMQSLIQSQKK